MRPVWRRHDESLTSNLVWSGRKFADYVDTDAGRPAHTHCDQTPPEASHD